MWRRLPEKVLLCFGRFLDREFDQREARGIVIEGLCSLWNGGRKQILQGGQENATEALYLVDFFSPNHMK